MVKVTITCPECKGVGYLEVEKNLISESERGVTAVNVAEDLICKHSFIAYIDKNFAMRDSFITDFKIKLPEIQINEASLIENTQDTDNIDLYLISLNLPALTLSFLLRASFNGKKILLINDLDVLRDYLKNFFAYLFENNFNIDISIFNYKFYKENKKKFKEHIVIDKDRVISDKTKLLSIKQMKIENAIVQKFSAEYDPKVSLIILKNEIQKAYNLTRDIVQMNEELNDGEFLNSKQMLDNFERSYGVKIGKNYLDFLIGVATNYFKVKFQQATGASDLIKYF